MITAARYRAACHALGMPVWRPGMRAVAARPEPLEPVCSRAPDDLLSPGDAVSLRTRLVRRDAAAEGWAAAARRWA
jgi:hypothetical protein